MFYPLYVVYWGPGPDVGHVIHITLFYVHKKVLGESHDLFVPHTHTQTYTQTDNCNVFFNDCTFLRIFSVFCFFLISAAFLINLQGFFDHCKVLLTVSDTGSRNRCLCIHPLSPLRWGWVILDVKWSALPFKFKTCWTPTMIRVETAEFGSIMTRPQVWGKNVKLPQIHTEVAVWTTVCRCSYSSLLLITPFVELMFDI